MSISTSSDESGEPYRAVSVLAVAALVVGLASAAAWLHPLLWTIPPLGLVLGAVALVNIRRYAGGLTGRKAAWAGLTLALFSGVGAPTHWLADALLIKTEAARVTQTWFGFLRDRQPQFAHQLNLAAGERLPLDDNLPARYRQDKALGEQLHQFLENPVVCTLLALGDRAEVRFYDAQVGVTTRRYDRLEEIYAVTYLENDQRKSFFVQLLLERLVDPQSGALVWRVVPMDKAYRPADWPSS